MQSLILSAGLCPSNHGNTFPNLARVQNPPLDVIADVTAICENELKLAGIKLFYLPCLIKPSEVPSRAFGNLSMWGFERAWYYWIARGPGLPVEVAERLHALHGTQVRVDGHCSSPSPREWFKGFGVGHYHVDTQLGLNALADALRSVYDNRTEG